MDLPVKNKYFTPTDVAAHNQRDDCWIIINNHVYDVSKYLSSHPGGKLSILRFAGKDATEMFFKLEHSIEAQQILSGFEIGLVALD